MTATAPPGLAADLEGGLRRLKLAAMRQVAPQLLTTAKTQRWTPEELLRALVEAEIGARDASNTRLRLKAASFPMVKTIEEFDLAASSIPAPTWHYLTSLEWIRAAENLCLVGPAGTGKSHTLLALGHAAVLAGHRVRYFTAADLVENLYRGLADNSVGRVIDTLLRNDLIIVDDIGLLPVATDAAEGLYRLVDAAYEKRSIAVSSNLHPAAFDELMPKTLATATVDRLLHHAHVCQTTGDSVRLSQALAGQGVRPLT